MEYHVSEFNTIVHKCRDAVVSIYGKNSQTPLRMLCNGFFFKPGKILTLFDKIRDFEQIYIIISNFNGHGKKKLFSAVLKDFDNVSNCAILEPNIDSPCFHSSLSWGKSRNLNLGEVIFVIGITSEKEENNTVHIANVSDPRFSDKEGETVGELVLLCGINFFYYGMPIFSMNGKVVGMVNNNNTALSEYFLRFPLLEFAKGQKLKKTLKLKAHPITPNESLEIMELTSQKSISIEGYYIEENLGLSKIERGDILLTIGNKKIGSHKGQSNPILELWSSDNIEGVEITYLSKRKRFQEISEYSFLEDFENHVFTI